MFVLFTWLLIVISFFIYKRLFFDGGEEEAHQRSLAVYLGIPALLVMGFPAVVEISSFLGMESFATFFRLVSDFCCGTVIFGFIYSAPVLVFIWLARKSVDKSKKTQSARAKILALAAPLVLGAMISGYGIWEAGRIQTRFVTLKTSKLSADVKRIRLAAFADLHIKSPVRYALLEEVAEVITANKPDLILALGDILDGRISNNERTSKLLSEFQAPLGKFFVYGNHEMPWGRNQDLDVLKAAGFQALINEGNPIGNINLIGVTDAGSDDFKGGVTPDLIKNGNFTILMKHRPIVPSESKPFFDLQLSGHTHGGQIFPLMHLVELRYPYLNGLYEVGDRKWIYTTPGAGTYGPAMRILSPPEIVFIDLVPE